MSLLSWEDFMNLSLTDEDRKIVDEEYRKVCDMLAKEQEMKNKLDNWFTYHQPEPEDAKKYELIRQAARAFAQIVVENTPESADQTTAIRKIREAVMTAIACKGK